MRTIYILMLVLILMPLSVKAQTHEVKAENDNQIITAVSLYNERKFDKAAEVLDGIIAADLKNDAAWYYLSLCAVSRQAICSARACALLPAF